ncbi:MAG: hypothetical protein KGD63_12975 [Candidatus Lokiarchaeota archaeon]|nr:hypothetical protein [Candidatus Lokiarchaeota archaeon]
MNIIDVLSECHSVFVVTLWAQCDIKNFYNNSPDPKELSILDGDMERFDTYNYFGEHLEKMISFLKENGTKLLNNLFHFEVYRK